MCNVFYPVICRLRLFFWELSHHILCKLDCRTKSFHLNIVNEVNNYTDAFMIITAAAKWYSTALPCVYFHFHSCLVLSVTLIIFFTSLFIKSFTIPFIFCQACCSTLFSEYFLSFRCKLFSKSFLYELCYCCPPAYFFTSFVAFVRITALLSPTYVFTLLLFY